MKKTILFFSVILIGTFIMFGFQNSTNLNIKNNNEFSVEKQNIVDVNTTFKINSHNLAGDKCGAGKCGGGKAKKAKNADSKCGAGKCGSGKSEGKKHDIMDSDTNGDGKISMNEFSAHATKEFSNKDKNSDGKVTSDECPMFDKFNTDGNDFLSKNEFMTGHSSLFKKSDKNNDGFINASEAKNMHKSGEGKCGEGKCGGDKKESKKDSKCGTGKCGG